jgi:ElaA protein
VENADRTAVDWHRFADLSPALLYEMLRFRQAVFVVEQRCPYPDLDGLDLGAAHLLLRRDGALAGCLRVVAHPTGHSVAIGRVAVAAPLRRRGFARLMMAQALARCRADHPDRRVTLSAQAYLEPFYASLGFRPVSAPYDDHGIAHVEMELPAGG